MQFNGGATYEPTNQSSASTTLTHPSLRSTSPPPPPPSHSPTPTTFPSTLSCRICPLTHSLLAPSTFLRPSTRPVVTGLWPVRWSIGGCVLTASRWREARVVQGSPWPCALRHVSPRQRNVHEQKLSSLLSTLCSSPRPSAGQCSFIWISGPRPAGTALCQGASHSLFIVSPLHAHPWGAQPGQYVALGALASVLNIESMLKIINECLQKRGSPKGQRAMNSCLRALPTRSDPTCSGNTTRCATRFSRMYSLPLRIASL